MRRILAASLLLSPLVLPAAAVASQPVKDASAPTSAPTVSTGFIAPTILHTTDVIVSPDFAATLRGDSTVVLTLNLDEQGNPADIHVIQSANPYLDAGVVDAVRQFRWHPAILDNQPVPTDLTLTLNVEVKH